MLSLNSFQRMIEFRNGARMENIIIQFYLAQNKLKIATFYGSTFKVSKSSNEIPLAEWTHVAITASSDEVSLYLNALKEYSYIAQIKDVERTQNFIGKSNSSDNTNIHVVFDEMKIYRRALSLEEIAVEKNKKKPYDFIHN